MNSLSSANKLRCKEELGKLYAQSRQSQKRVRFANRNQSSRKAMSSVRPPPPPIPPPHSAPASGFVFSRMAFAPLREGRGYRRIEAVFDVSYGKLKKFRAHLHQSVESRTLKHARVSLQVLYFHHDKRCDSSLLTCYTVQYISLLSLNHLNGKVSPS